MRYFELNYLHARRYFDEFKDLLQYKVFWCASDLIAAALCDVLRACGATPGVDVMVIGYDNLNAVIPDFRESLTTIDPGWDGLGKTVAGLILKQIDKKEPSPEILKLNARVVPGKSFPLPESI
jgi:DNA-binding LacI/PurR family transcriptional regulator